MLQSVKHFPLSLFFDRWTRGSSELGAPLTSDILEDQGWINELKKYAVTSCLTIEIEFGVLMGAKTQEYLFLC